MKGPRVVAIGGGHGLAMLLKAVGTYAGCTTAIVATGDDGGSSGRLRECIAMPAPGDLRRCIAAVSPNRELAQAMEHRFTTGDLAVETGVFHVIAGAMQGSDITGHERLAATNRDFTHAVQIAAERVELELAQPRIQPRLVQGCPLSCARR